MVDMATAGEENIRELFQPLVPAKVPLPERVPVPQTAYDAAYHLTEESGHVEQSPWGASPAHVPMDTYSYPGMMPLMPGHMGFPGVHPGVHGMPSMPMLPQQPMWPPAEMTLEHQAYMNAARAFQQEYQATWHNAAMGAPAYGQGGLPSMSMSSSHDKWHDTSRPKFALHPDKARSMPLDSNVWLLAQDSVGCRRLQDVLESGQPEEKQVVKNELIGKVAEAIQCKHCNHVLQKLIVVMNPSDSKFVIEELMSSHGSAAFAAAHVFGCRVVERLIEHCRQADLSPLVENILSQAQDLSMNEYGNYVLQELLERGQKEQKHEIAVMLAEQKDNTLFTNGHACNVVRSALTCCSSEDQIVVANRLLRDKGLIARMACHKHGHLAVQTLLQMPGEVGEKASAQLAKKLPELRSSRFGREIEKLLMQKRETEGATVEPAESTPDA